MNFHGLQSWQRPSNYIGPSWDGWMIFLTRTRDSGLLTNHNFATALKKLEALPKVKGIGKTTVQVVRDNHWAVGWIEWIAIHPRNKAATALAEQLAKKMDDYPILDETGYGEAEHAAVCETWEQMSLKERASTLKKHNPEVSLFAIRHPFIPQNADYTYDSLRSEL